VNAGGAVSERSLALRSIEHHDAKVSVQYRHRDVEVMVVEVCGRASLDEPTLWGDSSWHIVLDGEAVFSVAGRDWEVLPGQALRIDDASAYTIANPARDRLRLLSVVVGGGHSGAPGDSE
jgi:hypothetical protein